MNIRIYDPPTVSAPTFRVVGMATAATSVTTVERLYKPGYFKIEIPWAARHAEKLAEGALVLIEGTFWGIIDDLNFRAASGESMRVATGRQLNGLTVDRITIPPDFTTVTGAQGYDAATGPTETIMKHFVAGNMRNPAQPNRIIYGLEIATDQRRGTANDKYMSRHENLSDVLADLGEAAELGYDITPDLKRHKLVFDAISGQDHTAGQSDRKRVVFDIRRKTALSQEYNRNTSDSRNIFYATMSGSEFADDALTVTYLRDGEAEPVGIRRREQHLDISADTPTAGQEYNEMKRQALIEAEKFRAAESFTCDVTEDSRCLYGRDYALGDLVTVQNVEWGVTMNTRITEMQTEYGTGGLTRKATFGTAPLNVISRLRRQVAKGG